MVMNIAYLTQLTNLQISDKSPLEYLIDYDDENFEDVLKTHLILWKYYNDQEMVICLKMHWINSLI